jgi:DNA-binding transcriptional regulator YdaS (Cro superfamily)
MKNKMTEKEMVNYWSLRNREKDLDIVSERTGLSKSHVCNMIKGRRSLNPRVARTLYRLASRRLTNKTLAQRHNISIDRVPYQFSYNY